MPAISTARVLSFMTKKTTVPDQAAEGQDLDGERVGCRETVPMRGEERLPRRVRAALRGGRDAVVLEDRLDRVPAHLVAEALQPTADARVAPGRILVRHADHKRRDVWLGRRATGASRVGTVVFLGDEPPVPAQDRVGCHDTGHVRQAASAENAAFHGQAAALVVGEAQPSGSVRGAEDPVLLEQVVDDRLLLPVNPARDQQEQEGERARQRVHGGSLSQRGDSVQGAQVDFLAVRYDFPALRSRPSIRTARDATLSNPGMNA